MSADVARAGSVVALCGGIGGAKLALGLSHVVPADRLSIVVNTGDDFRHLGLHVSPDIDTVTYTLAGRANRETGWGREGETWRFMDAVAELGGETWFRLGDTDLATSAVRTMRLEAGDRLTDITRHNARALGVESAILPVTDDPLATIVETADGPIGFQHYFVQRKCEPRVEGVRYAGAAEARVTPEVIAALSNPELSAIVLCPSNPYLSIDPMLAIPGFRACLEAAEAPVVAVSPIVGGRAVKGPLAKMMAEAGLDVSPLSVARHYGALVDVLIVDEEDRDVQFEGTRVHVAPTVMQSLEDRKSLAREALAVAHRSGGKA
jgi:LPPG:FO 2-phospho-L-lactate transferase